MAQLTRSALAQMIDHTLLKPEATRAAIETLCQEAIDHQFASVCVHPFRVAQAAGHLRGASVKVCTVIGFPLGANRAEVKAMESIRAVTDGAQELDMVMNIGAFKDQNLAAVDNDIRSVLKAAQGALVKVILETSLLDDAEITRACEIAVDAGAHFVKTSTGFGSGGARVEHIRLMRKAVGGKLGVKASGGIRDYETLLALVEAGASRIGTSSGVSLLATGTAPGSY